MSDLEILEQTGTNAVRQLRERKLSVGKPFMINTKELPIKQSYLEYPDHSISIVTIGDDSRSFTTLRKLSRREAQSLRRRFQLL